MNNKQLPGFSFFHSFQTNTGISSYKYNFTLIVVTLLGLFYKNNPQIAKVSFNLVIANNNMTIVWGGTLALLLSRLKKKPFEVIRIEHDAKVQIKRLGVYYMCIDDLPL